MDYIIDGIKKAIELLVSFDIQVYEIIMLSVFVSTTATIIAAAITVPIGVTAGIANFRMKGIFSRTLYALMSVPSVIVGLVVAIALSRKGPLGQFQLLYTPVAMIIAQSILVSPLCMGLTYSLSKNRGNEIARVGKTLGANRLQTVALVIRELKMDIFINVVTTFSRAISEVGAVMIVGGNIKGHTRVITTSIAMLNSMGDYPMAIALGIVLLIISFVINAITYAYQGE
ncbi:tungstate transport system permease protein [Peptoclostridium litorale DSM 5388]|uniref:Permease component of tungstate ABC transporter TupB n=1 Tax=Peptoclostridium litorale DSM 5388 TaxID=1121324 RepID=A0A069RDM9_PEPLI|nr:ABC transporter permease [Peptoclostridium litorale]KDR94868.1 permease component of tungstate ABC transporter TupB [Peptoclostridium litorale DSM 5388]SIN94484.1 tungstate transport system permease protein [Peptoclostridium litorale DSM 5388]